MILDNLEVENKTDEERKLELESIGLYVWPGLVHGANNCLTDSLLQALAYNNLLPENLRHDTGRRKEMCTATRNHLINHENYEFHPVRRIGNGAIADVSDEEHSSAFLQHDVHAEPIVRYLVDRFNDTAVLEPRGVEVTV